MLLNKLKKRALKAIPHSAKEKVVWNGEVATYMALLGKEDQKRGF